MLPRHKYGETGRIACKEFIKIMNGEYMYNLFICVPFHKIDYSKTTKELMDYIFENTGYEKLNVFSDNVNGKMNSFIIKNINEQYTCLITCITSYDHEMNGCVIEVKVQKTC